MADGSFDYDGRDLAWLAVLGSVMGGAVPLGTVVARLESLAADDLIAAGAAGRYLQEMARGGQIVMVTDGLRWTVAPGPKARASFERLLALKPQPLAAARNQAFEALCRVFAPARTAYAV